MRDQLFLEGPIEIMATTASPFTSPRRRAKAPRPRRQCSSAHGFPMLNALALVAPSDVRPMFTPPTSVATATGMPPPRTPSSTSSVESTRAARRRLLYYAVPDRFIRSGMQSCCHWMHDASYQQLSRHFFSVRTFRDQRNIHLDYGDHQIQMARAMLTAEDGSTAFGFLLGCAF